MGMSQSNADHSLSITLSCPLILSCSTVELARWSADALKTNARADATFETRILGECFEHMTLRCVTLGQQRGLIYSVPVIIEEYARLHRSFRLTTMFCGPSQSSAARYCRDKWRVRVSVPFGTMFIRLLSLSKCVCYSSQIRKPSCLVSPF